MKLGDFPFGQGDDRNPGKAQLLEQGRHVRLVAADAIERLSEHDIERTALSILQQGLDARTKDHARTGNSGILVRIDDRPLLTHRAFSANTKLVFDRGVTLIVRRVSGIERNSRH
ncbi:hypothetical protein XI04_16265 [Bradyrhizobium sp. CCBAU 11430]|nr:hypothetical protein [Bradyrhizobium sp. CCBAU 21360]MDA9456894.1 hypothetical protein [Bradyrhizobium sp. CCBAU 21359]MDA9514599.1 hypothetical protein [Bradyrhizobium sp. CCBAU 11430]